MIKKKIIFLLIVFFNTGSFFSQSLTLVASNPVGDENILHTLKISTSTSSIVNYSDNDLNSSPLNKEVEKFMSFAKNKKGLQRITFDPATNTFSILSDTEFNIESLIHPNNSTLKPLE